MGEAHLVTVTGKARTKSSGSMSKEMLQWMFFGPLYAVGVTGTVVTCATLIVGFPPLLGSPTQTLLEIISAWWIVTRVASGYVFAFAVIPAMVTGVGHVIIQRVTSAPKHVTRLTYGLAALMSLLSSLVLILPMSSEFSLTVPFWGKPVYSWMGIFVGMGLVCCWLMLRTKRTIAS